MRVTLFSDGRALVETAHHEIGNGIYTVLAMQAAARLGTTIEAVTVRLGDTALPPAGISGGSSTTTSLVPTLLKGCDTLCRQLANAAITHNPRFTQFTPEQLTLRTGLIIAPNGQSIKVSEIFAYLATNRVETLAEAAPDKSGPEAIPKLREGKLMLGGAEDSLTWSYGAQFAEVHVHALTGQIRVSRLIGAFSAGYIINRLTALSQLRGGMIWGIGAALLEATVPDHRMSRYVNDNLAEYLVPTAADTGQVEAILLDADADSSKLMGLGELGIIGVNAAIANALHHATGARFRTLPIRIEDVLPHIDKA